MKCEYCGQEIDDNSKVCSYCGSYLLQAEKSEDHWAKYRIDQDNIDDNQDFGFDFVLPNAEELKLSNSANDTTEASDNDIAEFDVRLNTPGETIVINSDDTTSSQVTVEIGKPNDFQSNDSETVEPLNVDIAELAQNYNNSDNSSYSDESYNYNGSNGLKTIIIAMGSILVIGTLFYFYLFRGYSINYNSTIAFENSINPSKYRYVDGYVALKDVSCDGYYFDGWYSDSSFSKKVKGIKSGSRGSVNLYAKWTPITYYIEYYTDGSMNNYSNPSKYNVETDNTPLYSPNREGYVFKYWINDETGEQISSIYKGLTGDLYLRAVWDVKRYNIRYYNTNGVQNPNPTIATIDDLVELNDLVSNKEGYEFGGWYTDASYNNQTSYIYNLTSDLDLYAKWTPIQYNIYYDIYYYGNYNNYTINPQTYTIESNFSLNDPMSDGYTFDGWYDQYGNRISRISPGKTGDLYITAKWKVANYTITYCDTKGAYNPNPTSYNVESGGLYLDDLYKDGYTFIGWYDQYGNQKNYLSAYDDKNIVLYARWE